VVDIAPLTAGGDRAGTNCATTHALSRKISGPLRSAAAWLFSEFMAGCEGCTASIAVPKKACRRTVCNQQAVNRNAGCDAHLKWQMRRVIGCLPQRVRP
jgi:hypothetical protein